MKIKRPFSAILLALAFIIAFLLPFISWFLAAIGLPVNSLLSDDGLRWLFIQMPYLIINYPVALVICAFSAFACLEYVNWGEDFSANRMPVLVSLAVALFIDVLLLLGAFHPHSPLISLAGRLISSPFLHGLPFILCFGVVLVAYVYGILTRQIIQMTSFRDFICAGFHRYGAWMILSMLVSFIYYCLIYII